MALIFIDIAPFTTLARRLLGRLGMDSPTPLPIDLAREPAQPRRPQAGAGAQTTAGNGDAKMPEERADFAALVAAVLDQPAALPAIAPGTEQAAKPPAMKSLAPPAQTAANRSATLASQLRSAPQAALETQPAPQPNAASGHGAADLRRPPIGEHPATPEAAARQIAASQSPAAANTAHAQTPVAPPSAALVHTAPAPTAAAAPSKTDPAPPSAKLAAQAGEPAPLLQAAAPPQSPPAAAEATREAPALAAAAPVAAETSPLRAGRDELIRAKPGTSKANPVGASAAASAAPGQSPMQKPALGPARAAPSAGDRPAAPPSLAPDGAFDYSMQSAHAAPGIHTAAESARAGVEAQIARAHPAAAQLAQQIVRRAASGATQFELRLDPPELGRVNVQLELSRDHRVTAHIAAEDPATLAQLSRAAREIEQTLQSAGLELAESGLSFDLAQGHDGGESARAFSAPQSQPPQDGEPEVAPARATLERWRGARVDLVA